MSPREKKYTCLLEITCDEGDPVDAVYRVAIRSEKNSTQVAGCKYNDTSHFGVFSALNLIDSF